MPDAEGAVADDAVKRLQGNRQRIVEPVRRRLTSYGAGAAGSGAMARLDMPLRTTNAGRKIWRFV
jgi:hypothetical protein